MKNSVDMTILKKKKDYSINGVPRSRICGENLNSCSGVRERLKRHRDEVARKVMVPEKWWKEEPLKDWIDYSAFDRILTAVRIASARASLAVEQPPIQFTTIVEGRK